MEILKKCSKDDCDSINPQPIENFYKNRRSRDGLCSYCKTCSKKQCKQWYEKNSDKSREYYNKDKSKINARHKRYNKTYSDRRRELHIRRKYSISISEYEDLAKSQNNKCKICDSNDGNKNLAVDHCHVSGEIRGLLCHKCNMALGLFNDDCSLLDRAKEYLHAKM